MKRKVRMILTLVTVAVMLFAFMGVAYATSYSYSIDNDIKSTGFTGTTHRSRTSTSNPAYLIATSGASTYLAWQSQWVDNDGLRHNGFETYGSVSTSASAKSYRTPYSGYTTPFVLKITNSSGSTIHLVGSWQP